MNIINILMDKNKSVCAFFKKKKYTLTIVINPIGGGAVTGAGIYNSGISVNISAIPNSGYVFTSWSGDLTGSTNPTTILINGNKSVTANFMKKIQYTLTTLVDPVGSGTITGGGTYDVGVNVNVEATPALDYDFDHWSGDVSTTKWSGLGMNIHEDYEAGSIDRDNASMDILKANGFTQLRVYIVGIEDAWDLARSKASVLRAIAKGFDVIWGVDQVDTDITAANWATYVTAVKSAATWAQANGVFEFYIGNEAETNIDGTTMTVDQCITNLKTLATAVQAIFTRGNVSYTCSYDYIYKWTAGGKGNLDILASNVYMGGDLPDPNWKANITALVNAFGTTGTYLTEFGLNWNDVDQYSTDEAVQAAGITEILNYIKASGMTRAIYFLWYLPGLNFGVLKSDGTYRKLWNSLIGNL